MVAGAADAGSGEIRPSGPHPLFLDRLTPGGVLSVSRWFDPDNVSETSRLVSLGIAALIDHGVERPADHLVLAVRERVATLMLSSEPFTEADRAFCVYVVLGSHDNGRALVPLANEVLANIAIEPRT